MYAICHPSCAVDVTLAKVQVGILIFLQYLIPSPNKLQLMCEMLPHSRSDCRIYLNPANTFDCRLIFGPLHDYWCVCVGYLVPHFCSKSSRQHVQRMALNWETMLDTSAPLRLLPISDGVSPVQWGLGDFIFVVYFILLQPTKFVFTAVSTTSSMVILWEIIVHIFVTSCIYYENPQVIGRDDRLGSAFAAARNLVGTTSRIICWQRVLCHVFCATHRFN